MCIFARRVKRPLDVSVQCPQHPDARMHQEVATFRGADQTSDCGLPFLEIRSAFGSFMM